MDKTLFASFLLLLLVHVHADVYMHNPRGSNDRNCERNENRNNGNRLFDSQNNAKGGYACPRAVGGPEIPETQMFYYVGSKLAFQWTAQHGCGGNENTRCEIVLQYMCNDPTGNPNLRDGTPDDVQDAATDTIPDDITQIDKKRFGYHETYDWYQKCKARSRNRGLFIADRNINEQAGARATRQNENGNRRGLECPEERDYYPYWTPTPWRDIAVLVDDASRCKWYQENSNNVKAYGECILPLEILVLFRDGKVPIEEPKCKDIGGTWKTYTHNIAPPECKVGPWQRDNHLGNQHGGYDASYNWTIPDFPQSKCVVRLRYNISTGDYPNQPPAPFASNAQNSKIKQNDNNFPNSGKVVWDNTSWVDKVKQDVVYQFTEPFAYSAKNKEQLHLELAMNTNQFGRTFQDRSYTFQIVPRPAGSEGKTIHNLGVTGKRGNIVQTYPAHEYDFAPNHLFAAKGDLIHFQWEGSDYNPRQAPNNGEGGPPDNADNDPNQASRADRSNIVETDLADPAVPHFKGTDAELATSMFPDAATAWKMAFINQDINQCLSMKELAAIPRERRENVKGNCGKLNAAASPYFNGGLVPMTKVGRFTYMSTRNNNFSNRNHKGVVIVFEGTNMPQNPPFAGMVAPGKPNPDFIAFEGQKGSQDPAKFNLIGCFKDMVDNIRDLPVMTMQSNKMEPNLCMGQCRSLSFKYAALQNSNECWCGNHYGRFGATANPRECNSDCQGDGFYKCGGPARNSVYNVTAERIPGGGCYITAKACPTKPTFNGTWWDNDWSARQKAVDVNPEACLARARDWFEYCFGRAPFTNSSDVAEMAVTATFRLAGKNTSQSYPSKEAGGCLISIAQCKNKQQPSPGWFYDTWGAGQSAYVLATHTIENVCKSRARDFHRACGNTFEPAVKALFLPSGKTFLFPGDQGGCLINNTACGKDSNYIGSNVYDLGGGDLSDRDPVACKLRARDFYGGCGMDAFDSTKAVTSVSLPTRATETFPGSGGGCIVSNNKCPKKPTEQKTFWDTWDNDKSGFVESQCMARAFDYFSYCHDAVAFGGLNLVALTDDLSTATFAKTGTVGSFPGTQGGCVYELSTCRAAPGNTKTKWVDMSRLTANVASLCQSSLVQLFNACQNQEGDVAKATFTRTGATTTYTGYGNLALFKAVKASSDAYGWKMANVVNGLTDGFGGAGACYHSATETTPWVQIDLGAPTAIASIVVYNRLDSASDRLNGFTIAAGATEATIAAIKSNVTAQNITTIPVSGTFQFIKLSIPGANKIINICEIEVYAAAGAKTNTPKIFAKESGKSAEVDRALLGCYNDSATRDLPTQLFDDWVRLSPKMCLEACRTAGFKFAGTQHSSCFCGNNYGRFGKLANQTGPTCVQKVCPGNSDYLCGGDWTNLVYSVDKYAANANPSTPEAMGCFIEQKCFNKAVADGSWYDAGGRAKAADEDEGRCGERARDWFLHCGNEKATTIADMTVKAIFKSAGTPAGKALTFPGTHGGCVVEIKACAADANRVGTKYVNNAWYDVSESICLSYARQVTLECKNFGGQTPVKATFMKTGKTVSFPDKDSGGCIFDFPKKCVAVPAWAGKTGLYPDYNGHTRDRADRDEAACHAAAKDIFVACNTVPDFENGEGVTATYVPTGVKATFPSAQRGGCIIEANPCKANAAWTGTKYDTWGSENWGTDSSAANCERRAQAHSEGCQNNAWGYNSSLVVTTTHLPTGKKTSYPGSAGGCVIKLQDCKTNGPISFKSMLDTDNGAALIEANCFQRGWDWFNYCQNSQNNVTATFGPTGKTIGTVMTTTTTTEFLQLPADKDHLSGVASLHHEPAFEYPVFEKPQELIEVAQATGPLDIDLHPASGASFISAMGDA